MGDRYRKNKGYADAEGVKFQLDLVILSLLNALLHHENWKISTENKKAGKFDDVVIELSNGTSIFIQAKHKKSETSKISKEQFLSIKKNAHFGLPKYFFSCEEIGDVSGNKTFIICTNAGIDNRGLDNVLSCYQIGDENILHCERATCSYLKFNQNILPELKDSVEAYFDVNLKDGRTDRAIITDENLKSFIEKLQLFSDYPSANDLLKIIEKLLTRLNNASLWKNISYHEIYRKVEEWLKQPMGEYITEIRAKGMLCEIVSDQYCESLKAYKVSFECDNFLFTESKRIFHIKAEGEYLLQMLKIYHILQNDKSKKLFMNPDNHIEAQKQIIDAFGLRQFAFLVMVVKRPVKENDEREISTKLREILEKDRYKKIILLTSSNNKLVQEIGLRDISKINGNVTFKDLSRDCQKRLLHKNVVFQGKTIKLEELLYTQAAEDNMKALNSAILANLIRAEEIKVGNVPLMMDEDVALYYICRTFERNMHEIERTEDAIPEETLYDVCEKVLLISDSAGMGKSTVLTKIAAHINKKYSHLWIIRINLNEYTTILRECLRRNKNKIHVIELLNSKEATKITNPLETFVFSINQKVVLMLDGVDEISPDYTDLIVGLISQCQEASNFSKIFVTTRLHLTLKLESALKVASFKMLPFTRSNQVDFLASYWAYNMQLICTDEKKCKLYAETLIDKMSSWIKSYHYSEINFAAIPMQVNMLAEIFQENTQVNGATDWDGCKEYLEGNRSEPKLPEKFNIAELYQMFIEKKRDVFVEKGSTGGNTVTHPALFSQFEGCLAHHRSIAIKIILNQTEADLFTNSHPKDKNIKEYVLKIGIVQRFGDEFQFIHRTFAEYFVAESIVRELTHKNRNAQFQRFLIDKILVYDRFEIVCVFLDILLQKVSLSPNILKNYRSFAYESNLNLIFHLARQGYVTLLELILKNINFKIIRGHEINISNWRVKITFKKRNTLNDLKIFARKAGVNIRNERGETPLHCAVRGGHLEMVNFLVERGAYVYVSNNDGSTAPHLAAELGMLHIVKYFVVRYPDIIIIKDGMNRTALQLAAAHNRLNTVKYLVKYGALLEDKDSEGCTAMHLAAKWGRLNTLDYLVREGAIIDTVDYGGRTPVHSAAKWAHLITLEYLVEHGAVIDARDNEGCTAMHAAARWGRLNTLKHLVEHGAVIDAQNSKGCTAIHLTAKWGRLNTLKYLVEQGAIVNVKDDGGCSPLHLAAEYNRLNVVKFLVEHGIDINIRDNKGHTALHLAIERDNFNITQYLKEVRY